MALLAALAMAGLCYAAVFVPGHPLNLSEYTGRLIIKLLCALGVGSLICLLVFLGLGVIYRKELDQRREECRQLAMKIMESRLGKPITGSQQSVRIHALNISTDLAIERSESL
jgi:hypothetical protein